MYSRKKVKLLVSNKVKEYEIAINNMMTFMKSSYACNSGINIFLGCLSDGHSKKKNENDQNWTNIISKTMCRSKF